MAGRVDSTRLVVYAVCMQMLTGSLLTAAATLSAGWRLHGNEESCREPRAVPLIITCPSMREHVRGMGCGIDCIVHRSERGLLCRSYRIALQVALALLGRAGGCDGRFFLRGRVAFVCACMHVFVRWETR